jgi:hypothetical protein
MITPSYLATATERVLPRLALDFTTGVLDPRVTVTRALNTATRVNSSGFIETVNADLPRFDYDFTTLQPKGLLIEQASDNIALYSTDYSNAVWDNLNTSGTGLTPTVTADYGIAPDGTQTADRIQFSLNGGTASGDISRKRSIRATPVTSFYTNSYWLRSTDGVSTYNMTVESSDGYALQITVIGTWKRFSFVGAVSLPSGVNLGMSLGLRGARTPANSNTADVLVWNSQLEPASFATSDILTTSATVTRNADSVNMTGTNFTSWFNASEGTLSFEGSVFVDQGATTVDFIQISNGVSNAISIDLAMFGVAGPVFSVGNSGNQCNIDTGTLTLNTVFKMVGAYKVNSFVAALNGGTPGTDNTGTIPTVSQMGIGNRLSGPYMNGHARKFAYWPQRLINAEVQAFSK